VAEGFILTWAASKVRSYHQQVVAEWSKQLLPAERRDPDNVILPSNRPAYDPDLSLSFSQ
jgi:hypothetical protein